MMAALVTALVIAAPSGAPLSRTPLEAGIADMLCGTIDSSAPLATGRDATICVGFQGKEGGSTGQKAVFTAKVDHYSKLSVDSRAPPPSQ